MSKAASVNGLHHILAVSRLRAATRWQSLRVSSLRRQWNLPINHAHALQTDAAEVNDVPLRKQLKDRAKRKRQFERIAVEDGTSSNGRQKEKDARLDKWKLTVGLEIHAQLNTERKLFSTAKSSENDEPNTNVSIFDLAFPGSQPEFQKATLIPALRAALGLSCNIHRESRFDRKHYYYQDQPAGYQITQYYKPFAVDGHVTLYDHDGIAAEDGQPVNIAIKQVQMEQDTAKSTLQPPSTTFLDFNRVGHPLIEIITHPQIHNVQTASACVRKIQAILQAVNAVTTGMELGGLRADVNVSVSHKGSDKLGQRTEIKNLSSFRAVEDSIAAERDRQIAVLEAGGSIAGETRGWTLGSTETKKLRGKEGEVDYRYMPDPDIPPLFIGEDLVNHIEKSLPVLPDNTLADLTTNSGLTTKDAKTLISLDDGERLDYFDEVRSLWSSTRSSSLSPSPAFDKIVGNWVLHEMGGLLSAAATPFSPKLVPPETMADILANLHDDRITGTTAKQLLAMVFNGDKRVINTIIKAENLELQHLSRDEYLAMAQTLIDKNAEKVQQIQQKRQMGKLMWFVGQMMRRGEGKVEANKAEATLKELLGLD
ncbi:hypothetical protein ABVK25_002088 [Lepraria finkii]|uniref:Glutamyl-tRNA(Gln) amidotransferase subunit B, mitochondrial n=1 Tax=Lepraria finkii TaxID=1340010 RepID=A0ABR4BIQ5_9LECA